ncbi:MAG TPA: acyltransferase, partial [Candidatus Acidoferrum sp.]
AWTGVDLFFVLSGFLIGGILIDARKSENYFQVFYVRRFFRIVPIYAAVLVSVAILGFLARLWHPGTYAWLNDVRPLPWYSYWTLTQNFWMARSNTSGLMVLAVTWSLAIEEQFYLTLPVMIRFLSKRALMVFVLSGIFLAPILRTLILVYWPDNILAGYVLMPCRADALLLGVLVAILLREQGNWERLSRDTRYFGVAMIVLSSGVAYLAWRSSLFFSQLMQTIGYTWVSLFYATVLLFVLTHSESVLSAILRNKALRWLGGLAYCTYLIHQTVLGFVVGPVWGQLFITSGARFMAVLSALAITLLLANLSWKFLELPLIRKGHRFNYREPEEHSGAAEVTMETKR